jgi:hypothetical protein
MFSLSHAQNFHGDEWGLRPPSNPRKRKGHIPRLATPWCTFLIRATPKSNHFFNEKERLGPQYGIFSPFEASKRVYQKAIRTRLYDVKG